jgi:hypothetical protein
MNNFVSLKLSGSLASGSFSAGKRKIEPPGVEGGTEYIWSNQKVSRHGGGLVALHCKNLS